MTSEGDEALSKTVRAVTSFYDLRRAIDDGVTYILVQEHLDLRNDGIPDSGGIDIHLPNDFALGWLPRHLRALQGDCHHPPPGDLIRKLNRTQAPTLRDGQCLLLSDKAPFFVGSSQMRLSNFYLQVQPPNGILLQGAITIRVSQATIRNITINGAAVHNCSSLSCGLFMEASGVTASDFILEDFDGGGAMIQVYPGSALAMYNTLLTRNRGFVPPAEYEYPHDVLISILAEACDTNLSDWHSEADSVDTFLFIDKWELAGGSPILAAEGLKQTYHVLAHDPDSVPICEMDGCDDLYCIPRKAQAISHTSLSLPFMEYYPEWERQIDQDLQNFRLRSEQLGLSDGQWALLFKVVVSVAGVVIVVLVIIAVCLVCVFRRRANTSRSGRQSVRELQIITSLISSRKRWSCGFSSCKIWVGGCRGLPEQTDIRDVINEGDTFLDEYVITGLNAQLTGGSRVMYNCHSMHNDRHVAKFIVFFANTTDYHRALKEFSPLHSELERYMPRPERSEANEDKSIHVKDCVALPFMVLRTPVPLADMMNVEEADEFTVLQAMGELSKALVHVHELGFVNRAICIESVYLLLHPSPVWGFWLWGETCEVGCEGQHREPGLCSPPEKHIAYDECHNHAASKAEDVYGMAAVLFYGLCGRVAWWGFTMEQVIEVIKSPSAPKPWWSSELAPQMGRYMDLIRWGLQYDPRDRPTAAEFEQALQAVFSSNVTTRMNLTDRVRAHVPPSIAGSTQSAASPPADSIQEQLASLAQSEEHENNTEHVHEVYQFHQDAGASPEVSQVDLSQVGAVNPASEGSRVNAYQAAGQVPTSGLWSATDSMLADVKFEFMTAQLSGSSVCSRVRRHTPVSIQQQLKNHVHRFRPRAGLSSQNGRREGHSAPLVHANSGSSPASSTQLTVRVQAWEQP